MMAQQAEGENTVLAADLAAEPSSARLGITPLPGLRRWRVLPVPVVSPRTGGVGYRRIPTEEALH